MRRWEREEKGMRRGKTGLAPGLVDLICTELGPVFTLAGQTKKKK